MGGTPYRASTTVTLSFPPFARARSTSAQRRGEGLSNPRQAGVGLAQLLQFAVDHLTVEPELLRQFRCLLRRQLKVPLESPAGQFPADVQGHHAGNLAARVPPNPIRD